MGYKEILRVIFSWFDEPHEKIWANLFLIAAFSGVYYGIFLLQSDSKNGEVFYTPYSTDNVSYFDALYFSFVVHFTLGFGDIFPASTTARVAVIFHTTLFWLVNLIDPGLVSHFTKNVVETASIAINTIVPQKIV